VEERPILQINAALDTVGAGQFGVEPTDDPQLGFPMWGGKDIYGTISRWLAKGKPGQLLTLQLTGPSTYGNGSGVLHHNSAGEVVGGPLSAEEWGDLGVEPYLGTPAVSGYVLASTDAGVRSWVPMSGGGGVAIPLGQIAVGTGPGLGSSSNLTYTAGQLLQTNPDTFQNSLDITGYTGSTWNGSVFEPVVRIGGAPGSGSLFLATSASGTPLLETALYGSAPGSAWHFVTHHLAVTEGLYLPEETTAGRFFLVGADGKVVTSAQYNANIYGFVVGDETTAGDGTGYCRLDPSGFINAHRNALGSVLSLSLGQTDGVTNTYFQAGTDAESAAYYLAGGSKLTEDFLGGWTFTGALNIPSGYTYNINGTPHGHQASAGTMQ